MEVLKVHPPLFICLLHLHDLPPHLFRVWVYHMYLFLRPEHRLQLLFRYFPRAPIVHGKQLFDGVDMHQSFRFKAKHEELLIVDAPVIVQICGAKGTLPCSGVHAHATTWEGLHPGYEVILGEETILLLVDR